jgi:predicted Zn-dependent peptidase
MKRPSCLKIHCLLSGVAVVLAAALSPAADGQERFRRTPPLPDSFRELRLPEITSIPLPNGLTLSVTPRPGSPLVTIQIVILAGERDSPQNLQHAAALTARMIGRGAREFSADDLENMIESMGGDFSAAVFMDYTVLTFHVLGEHFGRALDVLRLMVLAPEFKDSEVSTVKRVYSYELRELEKDPLLTGRRQLLRVLFEGHPYQASTSSWDVIKYIGAKDLQAFYTRYYVPNNAVFVVSGDVDGPAVAREVGRRFNSWVGRSVERPPLPPPPVNSKERICFVDQPTSQDAVIFVGQLVMSPTSPDYFPFLVLNQLVGGTMNSRLFMNLRESKGYAYEAFSEAEFFGTCGVFCARAKVTSETIHDAVQEIIKEFRDLASEKFQPAEIEEAKSFLVGHLPLRFEPLQGYAARLAQVVALGLDAGHWNRITDSLMLVNTENVLEAAQKYLAAVPVVVIVGNRQWAAEALKDFNLVEVYDSTGALKTNLRQGAEK